MLFISENKRWIELNWIHTGLFPSLWTFFWKHYKSFISLWNYLNFWYVNYWHLIYERYFVIFFKILTISGQKRQICERTLNLFANFCAAPMNLEVLVKDSPQEKLQVLKIIKKPKFGVAEKSVFFVLFILYWKVQ